MKNNNLDFQDTWMQTDKYFQFFFDDFKTFGSRLKKWRELNQLTQNNVAEAIFFQRQSLGLSSVSINSLIKAYGHWEKKETNFVFSLNNFRILKNLLNADYDFLFLDCNTPHKHTPEIMNKTCLSPHTIEKLSSLSVIYHHDNLSSNSYFSKCILDALNLLLSDDDFLCYLSYFLTHYCSDKSLKDKEFTTISLLKPLNGSCDEDSILDGDVVDIDMPTQLSIFSITLSHKLCDIRDRQHSTIKKKTFTNISTDTGKEYLPLGTQLKKWRTENQLTQDNVADMIINYKTTHGLIPKSKKSTLRTYQNWETKTDSEKDIRISFSDIKMLKTLLNCDYEYLFGESNELKKNWSIDQILGLSKINIRKLISYAKFLSIEHTKAPAYAANILTSLDLITSDNELLSDLAYFLTDLDFYVQQNFCSLLKPIDNSMNTPADNEYCEKLFNGSEKSNVFLPSIIEKLFSLRRKNFVNSYQEL